MAPTRSRVSSKKQQPEIGLYMECEDEELTPAQKSVYAKQKTAFQNFNKKLNDYLKRVNGELIIKDEDFSLFEVNHTVAPPPAPVIQMVSPQQYPIQQGSSFLVVVPQQQSIQQQASAAVPQVAERMGTGRPSRQPNTQPSSAPLILNKPAQARTRSSAKCVDPEPTPTAGTTRGTRNVRSLLSPVSSAPTPVTKMEIPEVPTAFVPPVAPASYFIAIKGVAPIPPQMKPSEYCAYGGLVAGLKNTKNAPLTTVNPSEPDSNEVTIGKMKSYPSLIITARPHLLSKTMAVNAQLERANLDVQVKGVLMFTPAKFTEWLIQKGLIHNKRFCNVHVTKVTFMPVPLKLGMYSEVNKFPYSGGYVWIGDCCPNVYVSVFQGSLFEGSPHPPTVILKLLYHWACQTNVQNVLQWVQVDSLYVRNVYAVLRATCCEVVRERYGKIGGSKNKIEVGVISLGTSPQEGGTRRVKFEVMGAMNHETNQLRLRAIPPANPREKQGKRRFKQILEPLVEWLHKDSVILTDFTVDKETLVSLGFKYVHQSANTDEKPMNENVMSYLQRIVPKVFQNTTLHHLSVPIIQQFLDELVWRERWGPIAAEAFNNIISDFAYLMSKNYDGGLLKRLIAVAENPFRASPALEVTTSTSETSVATTSTSSVTKRTRKQKLQPEDDVELPAVVKKKPPQKEECNIVARWAVPQPEPSLTNPVLAFLVKKSDKDVELEKFYYGTLSGEEIGEKKPGNIVKIKCPICLKNFTDCLLLMKHVLLHLQPSPRLSSQLSTINQCGLCFVGFRTEKAASEHAANVHTPSADKAHLICQICEKQFLNGAYLMHHMHQMHVAAELPYACGVCHMRSSSYNIVFKHFVEEHRNAHHMFCPYCLISVVLVQKGKVMEGNVMFYVKHILRHHRQTEKMECNRCRLSFINRLVLQRHQEIDHASFHFQPDVKPLPLEWKTMMPLPGELIKPAHSMELSKPNRKPGCFTMDKSFDSLHYEAAMYLTCAECEGAFSTPHHFVGSMSCNKCRYKTCCDQAMLEHETVAHDSGLLAPPSHPAQLTTAMHCPCGFFTYSGDRLASHLDKCRWLTGYGVLEDAQADMAKSAGSKTVKSKSTDEPTVLNMLGLVRKSPEPVTKSSEERDEIAENLNRLFHGAGTPNEPTRVVEPRKRRREVNNRAPDSAGTKKKAGNDGRLDDTPVPKRKRVSKTTDKTTDLRKKLKGQTNEPSEPMEVAGSTTNDDREILVDLTETNASRTASEIPSSSSADSITSLCADTNGTDNAKRADDDTLKAGADVTDEDKNMNVDIQEVSSNCTRNSPLAVEGMEVDVGLKTGSLKEVSQPIAEEQLTRVKESVLEAEVAGASISDVVGKTLDDNGSIEKGEEVMAVSIVENEESPEKTHAEPAEVVKESVSKDKVNNKTAGEVDEVTLENDMDQTNTMNTNKEPRLEPLTTDGDLLLDRPQGALKAESENLEVIEEDTIESMSNSNLSQEVNSSNKEAEHLYQLSDRGIDLEENASCNIDSGEHSNVVETSTVGSGNPEANEMDRQNEITCEQIDMIEGEPDHDALNKNGALENARSSVDVEQPIIADDSCAAAMNNHEANDIESLNEITGEQIDMIEGEPDLDTFIKNRALDNARSSVVVEQPSMADDACTAACTAAMNNHEDNEIDSHEGITKEQSNETEEKTDGGTLNKTDAHPKATNEMHGTSHETEVEGTGIDESIHVEDDSQYIIGNKLGHVAKISDAIEALNTNNLNEAVEATSIECSEKLKNKETTVTVESDNNAMDKKSGDAQMGSIEKKDAVYMSNKISEAVGSDNVLFDADTSEAPTVADDYTVTLQECEILNLETDNNDVDSQESNCNNKETAKPFIASEAEITALEEEQGCQEVCEPLEADREILSGADGHDRILETNSCIEMVVDSVSDIDIATEDLTEKTSSAGDIDSSTAHVHDEMEVIAEDETLEIRGEVQVGMENYPDEVPDIVDSIVHEHDKMQGIIEEESGVEVESSGSVEIDEVVGMETDFDGPEEVKVGDTLKLDERRLEGIPEKSDGTLKIVQDVTSMECGVSTTSDEPLKDTEAFERNTEIGGETIKTVDDIEYRVSTTSSEVLEDTEAFEGIPDVNVEIFKNVDETSIEQEVSTTSNDAVFRDTDATAAKDVDDNPDSSVANVYSCTKENVVNAEQSVDDNGSTSVDESHGEVKGSANGVVEQEDEKLREDVSAEGAAAVE